jgi:SAM-dependent methyltransferase
LIATIAEFDDRQQQLITTFGSLSTNMKIETHLKQIAKQTLPSSVWDWLSTQKQIYQHRPPLGLVRWGELRRMQPLNAGWGFERGQPIDRYYIEDFLARQSQDIRGKALEIGDDVYLRQFGGDRLTSSDILHIESDHPKATIIADLADADGMSTDTFDSFLLIQTLQLIYEVRLALSTTYRVLKPGGVVLATFPGITPLKDREWNDCWCWNFTAVSALRLFGEVFPAENIRVETYGNILSATAFLHGLASQELSQQELEYRDPAYAVIIAVRAEKPLASS